MKPVERFLKYVSFDTQSKEESETFPSTLKQLELGKHLYDELKSLGIENVRMDEYGYVYAKIPSNCGSNQTLGLISHMDTSPDASGKNINPRIVTFNGEDIVLENGLKLAKEDLLGKEEHNLIVTDGSTLLGADDKAGIAIIMSFVECIIHTETKHPNIIVCFTPDEEVGAGTDHFDFKWYLESSENAYTYTVDGGDISEINYETFNAASAKITILGKSIHPGSAKNKMINAQLVAAEFIFMLPQQERPEHTEGYEGFYHLTSMSGDVSLANLNYIIRDHNRCNFEKRKEKMLEIAKVINDKYGEEIVKVSIEDSYYNMKEKIIERMDLITIVQSAMMKNGINPVEVPIRGGTDGARLSFEGIPCPNLGTGGENFHGPLEYLDIDDFMKMIEVIKTISNLLI